MQINYSQTIALILAAGQGTRMNSDLPKVLHTIGGKPIVSFILDKLQKLSIQTSTIVGFEKELVIKTLGPKYQYFDQGEIKGTGDAVVKAIVNLDPKYKTVAVFNGDDSAFFTPKTLDQIFKSHWQSDLEMTLVTCVKKAEISGRVIRDKMGQVIGIKANSELSKEELEQNNEMVCGFYIFNQNWLKANLPKIKPFKVSREVPITGLIPIAIEQQTLNNYKLTDSQEWMSINTKEELEKAEQVYKGLR